MRADIWLYGITIVTWGSLWIWFRIKERRENEFRVTDLDKISAAPAQLDTTLFQAQLRPVVEQFEQGRVCRNEFLLPKEQCDEEFYRRVVQDIYQDLARGVQCQLQECAIGELRVRPLDRAQLYAITDLAVTAPVTIRHVQYANGRLQAYEENGVRRYLFRNKPDGWKLYAVDWIEGG